jgi:hypothetical protein
MSNDERVKELNKKLDVSLEYSDKIDHKQIAKPNKTKLKHLAAQIRKNLEEISVETTAHSHPGR